MLFTSGPLDIQPARLPTLDVDQAMAISVALWQWQEARLQAVLRTPVPSFADLRYTQKSKSA
jgi:hypothetical protein